MMKRFILAAAATFIFTISAQAGHCPSDMAKIDAVLPIKMSQLSADTVSEIKALRRVGEALHKDGNHRASEDSLARAMRLLGIK